MYTKNACAMHDSDNSLDVVVSWLLNLCLVASMSVHESDHCLDVLVSLMLNLCSVANMSLFCD